MYNTCFYNTGAFVFGNKTRYNYMIIHVSAKTSRFFCTHVHSFHAIDNDRRKDTFEKMLCHHCNFSSVSKLIIKHGKLIIF